MSVRVDYRCATCGGVAEHAVASPPPPERSCVACGSPAKRLFAPIGLTRSARSAGTGGPGDRPGSGATRGGGDALCLRAPAIPGICHMQPDAARAWAARARGDNRALERELERQERSLAETGAPLAEPVAHGHHHHDQAPSPDGGQRGAGSDPSSHHPDTKGTTQ